MEIVLYETDAIGCRLGMLNIFDADDTVDKRFHLFPADGFHDTAPRFGGNDAADGTGFLQMGKRRSGFREQMGIGRHVKV